MSGSRVKLAKLKAQAREEKLKLHKDLSNKYFKLFRFMDILVAIIILTNFMAIGMTNILAVKQQPEQELFEANPVQVVVGEYEQHEEVNYWNYMSSIVFNFFMWLVLIACYIFCRRAIYTERQLTVMMIAVLYYFTIIGIDFFNNLGFLIGRLIYG